MNETGTSCADKFAGDIKQRSTVHTEGDLQHLQQEPEEPKDKDHREWTTCHVLRSVSITFNSGTSLQLLKKSVAQKPIKRDRKTSSEGSSVLNPCWKRLHLFMVLHKEHTNLRKLVGWDESRIWRQLGETHAAS